MGGRGRPLRRDCTGGRLAVEASGNRASQARERRTLGECLQRAREEADTRQRLRSRLEHKSHGAALGFVLSVTARRAGCARVRARRQEGRRPWQRRWGLGWRGKCGQGLSGPKHIVKAEHVWEQKRLGLEQLGEPRCRPLKMGNREG